MRSCKWFERGQFGKQQPANVKARAASRRGAIVVLSAFLMIVMLGMIAMAVDLGYIANTRTELQRAADAGALAGADAIADGTSASQSQVYSYVAQNIVGGRSVPQSDVAVTFGSWDPVNRTFITPAVIPSAIKVELTRASQPLFFGGVLGKKNFDTTASSIATYQPRDIMVVLDFSGSMNDDSSIAAINRMGYDSVAADLMKMHGELGYPTYGSLNTTLRTLTGTSSSIKSTLGLNSVSYPYPSGSWDDYIDYIKTDNGLNSVGARNVYSVYTLIDYWNTRRSAASETPTLWKCSAQPVTAVKDAFDVFVSYLQEKKIEDRIGLVIYTSSTGDATLESPMITNYTTLATTVRHRQAGHYYDTTNIGAGMQKGRLQLQNNARPGAYKIMIVMTDGLANLPGSVGQGKQFVRDEATAASAAKIPVITISLGGDADKELMQEVADKTGGVHFNVPGGQTVNQYTTQLKQVFRDIADHIPLKLVK